MHRVTEIRDLSSTLNWRFCPGKENPADIPSRGCKGSELVNNAKWWNGPSFLVESPEKWPDLSSLDTTEANKELVKSSPSIVQSTLTTPHATIALNVSAVVDITQFSCLRKLLRVTALVMKFVELCRQKSSAVCKELTASDIIRAEELWIWTAQEAAFANEIESLKKPGSKMVLLKQLSLFIDEKGVVRCYGRINNLDLSSDSKTPILLPPRHEFTDLLIRQAHGQVFHDGIRETLNLIREKYWIVHGRESVKRVLRTCVICKKYEGKPFPTPTTSQLPTDRVGDHPPFAVTGVDFAGPLYANLTKTSTSPEKVYVCLFTCGVTRAIHLELTVDLTCESFLQAFRCFAGHQGLPCKMLSDNAKTFTASAKEVKKIVQSPEIKRYLTDKQVDWEFIVEKAPWWGGFWERLVRSIKNCLKKNLGSATLTFEGFTYAIS